MPRGDGTGPMGFGPMSGRGAGFCASTPPAHDYRKTRPGFGMSSGMGFGKGRNFGKVFCRAGMPGMTRFDYRLNEGLNTSVTDEKEFLGNQVEFLEERLQQVKKHLNEFNEEID